MTDLLLPRRDEVAGVLLSVSCESWIGDDPVADHRALRDYFRAISEVAPGAVDIGDEPEPSSFDVDVECFKGVAHGLVTLEEWLRIADGLLLDLGDDEVLPPGDVSPTMGILDPTGLLPAVSLSGTEEGFGYGGYEPRLVASFYIAITTHETGDER
jgi:hypothetical protein